MFVYKKHKGRLMMLYRPCGVEELVLVYDARQRRWPPRLPEQPIFYPVTRADYAAQISREWNTTSGARLGYVTAFELDADYARRFTPQVVGARQHEELWVPAEELDTFNDHILGPIEVIALYAGAGARGHIPSAGRWSGLDARTQWVSIETHPHELEDLARREGRAIFANLPLWRADSTVDATILSKLERAWERAHPERMLPRCTAQRVQP